MASRRAVAESVQDGSLGTPGMQPLGDHHGPPNKAQSNVPHQSYGPPNVPPNGPSDGPPIGPAYGPPNCAQPMGPQQPYGPPNGAHLMGPQQVYGPLNGAQPMGPQQVYGPPNGAQPMGPQQVYGPPNGAQPMGPQQVYGPPNGAQPMGPQQVYGPPNGAQRMGPQQAYGPPNGAQPTGPQKALSQSVVNPISQGHHAIHHPPTSYGSPIDAAPTAPQDAAYPGPNHLPSYQEATTPAHASVFSPEFQAQYAKDYTTPEIGFLPPGTKSQPTNKVVQGEGCVPAKEDAGICFYFRVWISTLFHVLFVSSLLGLIIGAVMGSEYLAVFGIVAGISYLIMFTESLCAYDLRYLRDMKNVSEFGEYMGQMHNRRPTLSFHVECYHYETRYRTVTTTDSHGHTHTRTESYQERVVTYRETELFTFTRCRDLAPPTMNLGNIKATRIVFFRTYRFADQNSCRAFEQQSAAIRQRNRLRDRHMNYWEVFKIAGFTERMLAYVDESAKHPCFNPCLFVLVSACLGTWPYRWWFKRVTARTNYTWIKELGK